MEFDLDKEWTELLNAVTEEVTLKKLQENKEHINKIAEHGKTTGIYKHAADKSKEYGKDTSAVHCFKDMVYKVATAPTQIHARGAVFLIMPVIAEKLNEESD